MRLSATSPLSRLFCLIAAGVIAIALAACGDEPPPKPAAKAAPPAAQPAPAPEAKAAAAPKPAEPTQSALDSDLAARVKAALLKDPELNAHGIDVTAKDGVVTLFGTSTTRARRDAAAKIAGGVAGVKRVENSLSVVAGS